MANRKLFYSIKILFLVLFSLFVLIKQCDAGPNWQIVDQKIEKKVLQVNVGLKIKLQNNWVLVSDISSKKKYYVFTTSPKDLGFQVVGYGSAFSIFTDNMQKTFFVTNKHVIDNAKQIKEECEMFFAAVMFYADNYMTGKNNFQQLMNVINLANKNVRSSVETKLYEDTINAIWDCYDNNLSQRADPNRLLFNKYKKLVAITAQSSYFLHGVGQSNQPAIEAKVYKAANSDNPDLAILVAVISKEVKNRLAIIEGLSLDFKVIKDEDIQVVGYPEQSSFGQIKGYRPTFSAGKITKIKPDMFEFKAIVTKGDSGGPVISNNGEAIGIVTRKLATKEGKILPDYGAAIKIQELKYFAPELLIRYSQVKANTVRVR